MSQVAGAVPPPADTRFVNLVAAAAAIAGFLFGFDTAVINGGLVFLKAEMHLSDDQVGIATSALLIGCVIGSAVAGMLADRFGRRPVLIVSGAMFAVSAIGAGLPRDLDQFVAARLLGGLAIGVASTITPAYIAEVAPPVIRGRLVSYNQLAIVLGILASYLANWALAGVGTSSWRLMFGIAAIPAAIFTVSLWFIPESPRWLLARGRNEQARAILVRTLGAAATSPAMAEIAADLADERAGSWTALAARGMRGTVLVAVALAVFSQTSGINTIIYYGSILFIDTLHLSAASALAASALIGLVNLVFTIVALALIDRVGRRPLLLVSTIGMGAAQVGLAAAFYLHLSPWLIIGAVLAGIAAFAVGFGPCAWLLLTEMFPNRLRGRAMSLATTMLWLSSAGINGTFFRLRDAAGIPGTFLVNAACCFAAALLTWTRIPEMRGEQLEHARAHWRGAQV